MNGDSLDRALGRIEGKVDMVLGSLGRLRGDLQAHDTRIRFLENWRWWVLGIATGVGALSSVIVTLVIRMVR